MHDLVDREGVERSSSKGIDGDASGYQRDPGRHGGLVRVESSQQAAVVSQQFHVDRLDEVVYVQPAWGAPTGAYPADGGNDQPHGLVAKLAPGGFIAVEAGFEVDLQGVVDSMRLKG